MCTVAAWTVDLHGVRPAMGLGGGKVDRAALFIVLTYPKFVFERECPETKSCKAGPALAPSLKTPIKYNQ